LRRPKKRAFRSGRQLGWIGVDVGTSTIKLAQVERAGGQWRLACSLIVSMGDDPDSAPSSAGDGSFARPLSAALQESVGFRGRRAALALPLSAMELRTVQLPSGTDDELRTMIDQELSLAVGDSPADRLFDFWDTGLRRNSEKVAMRDLAVLSISPRSAEHAAEELLALGLKCQVFDGVPFALARAVAMDSASGGRAPVVALDWGFTSVTFVVAVDGQPSFVRSFRDCGVGRVVRSLCNEFGLTVPECGQLLSRYGIPHPETDDWGTGLQRMIYDLTAEPIASLLNELEKTFSYLRRQGPGLMPERILLFGGGSTINNCASLLSSRIGIPMQRWQPALLAGEPAWLGREIDHSHCARNALFGPAAALSALAFQA
jgi:Tfp pilus assembly PilM family ATPase